MTRGMWVGVAVVAAACGGGQKGEPQAGGAHGPTGVLITGCLRPVDQAGAAAVGTSGAAGPDRFMLAAATREGMGVGGSSYMLDGDAIELRQHLNQQVQVSGRVEDPQVPAGATPSSAPAATVAPGVSGAPRLRVESVRMVAAACTSE
jgi:hypothetical protein